MYSGTAVTDGRRIGDLRDDQKGARMNRQIALKLRGPNVFLGRLIPRQKRSKLYCVIEKVHKRQE